jgi:hypothetical protein
MNLRSRAALPIVALATTASLLVPAPAQAATTLGQTFASVDPGSCGGGFLEVFPTARADGTSYVAPAAGVLTSWSFMATPATTTLTLRVFRLVAAPDQFKVVADAGPQQTVVANSGLHTFPSKVPVQAGDIIGISASAGSCAAIGVAGDTARYRNVAGGNTPVGGTASYGSTPGPVKYDIAANWEPDADADGYGDETQDLCPQSAIAALTACPVPDTTITKHPKHAVFRVKIKFISSVPGSTFRCSLDKRKFKHCTSPLVYACPAPGTHHVKVLATAPYGLVEAKPAKVRFHVRGRARGC